LLFIKNKLWNIEKKVNLFITNYVKIQFEVKGYEK